ncbi:hypothetical protein FRX31_003038 [Thalictrum thalictroides]|uniref:Transposase MuDR plant domain-containing protein n=1 Tax=Thalictrum thalictroides TaxID=46969 RepID=A0A7J6XEU1_THATH|nr:hypothetical protein FRX31_003038 [Thalictrum thalictroides]
MDDDVRMFRIVYEGTWEQGEEPVLFPDRKLVTKNYKSEWVDDGYNMYPTYKYIGSKKIETFTKWDGDTVNIIDIQNWIRENLEGCGDPATIVDLYWLWGQRRFHIAKDVDILYFWKHASHDDRGYTELIVHTEKKTTPKHRTPKKRTKQVGGDQLVEEANKKRRKKLPVKRKIPTNEQFGDVSRGDKDEGDDFDLDFADSTRQKGDDKDEGVHDHEKVDEVTIDARDVTKDGSNAEKQGECIVNEVENQPEEGLNVEKQGEDICNEVEDQPEEGLNGKELVEDLSKNGGHKFGEGSNGDEHVENLCNDVRDDPDLVGVTVTFFGKTFNIDPLDASDEEYISGDEDNEESEINDEKEEDVESYIFRKRHQQEQRETKKDKIEGPSEPRPSDEAYESDDDDDREFIMKTKKVDDDENEERPEELRLERNMTWLSVYKAREYLVDYVVGHHFSFKYKKNNSDKLDARCKKKDCPWRAYIVRLNDKHTMECRSVGPAHTCQGETNERNCKATHLGLQEKQLMKWLCITRFLHQEILLVCARGG